MPCEINRVAQRGGQLVLTACGQLLGVFDDHVTRFGDCWTGGQDGPFTQFDSGDIVVVQQRCDLRTGAASEIDEPNETRLLLRYSRFYVARGEQHIRIIDADSERHLSLPEPLRAGVVSSVTDTVAVWADDRSATFIIRLSDPTSFVRIPLREGGDFLTDVDWRGNHVLLNFQFGVKVFRVRPLELEPVFERMNLRWNTSASLSPDGRWGFFSDQNTERCFSTEDGSERWWQQTASRERLHESRWTADGSSIVLRYPNMVYRIHAASGDVMDSLTLPTAPPPAISPNAAVIAICMSTLPGHDDELRLTGLRGHLIAAWEAESPPRFGPPSPITRVALPDGACVQARIRWLDAHTVAVFNNRLHVVRNGEVVLSLSAIGPDFDRSVADVWVRRDGGPYARARVLPRDPSD